MSRALIAAQDPGERSHLIAVKTGRILYCRAEHSYTGKKRNQRGKYMGEV